MAKKRRGKRGGGAAQKRPKERESPSTAAPAVEPGARSRSPMAVPTATPPAATRRDGRRVPGGWARPLLLGAVASALLAGGAEAAWRHQGQRPTVDPTDRDLWAAERRRASRSDGKAIVVLGKSRGQLGIDGPTIRRRYPDHDVIQLSLKGRGGFAAFRDLATDPSFRGRIIFTLTEPDLAESNHDAQLPEVEHTRGAGPDLRWNARLRAEVASRLVVRSYLLRPERLLDSLADRKLPSPNFVVTEHDRFTHADFSRADLELVSRDIFKRQQRVLRLMGDAKTPSFPWIDHMGRVAPLVDQLERRGGHVAFVHLPVGGTSYSFSERVYPKERFWEMLARAVPGRTVHFRDVASLQRFSPPDGSHLDEREAPAFTLALLEQLERQALLGPPPRSAPRLAP